jgi:stage III sporulation protein AF
MSEFLKEFGISVTMSIMLITIVDLILPETNIKKYINLICGLLVILLIFSPVVMLLKKGDFSFDLLKNEYQSIYDFNISEEDKSYSSYFFDAYNNDKRNSN